MEKKRKRTWMTGFKIGKNEYSDGVYLAGMKPIYSKFNNKPKQPKMIEQEQVKLEREK